MLDLFCQVPHNRPYTDDDHEQRIILNLREMGRDAVFLVFGIMIGMVIGMGIGMMVS